MNAEKKYDGQIYTNTGMKNNQEKKNGIFKHNFNNMT